MTTKDRIKEFLSDGEWHSGYDFITTLEMSSYSQRINEMIRDGEISVEKRHDPHNSAKHEWRLKTIGTDAGANRETVEIPSSRGTGSIGSGSSPTSPGQIVEADGQIRLLA